MTTKDCDKNVFILMDILDDYNNFLKIDDSHFNYHAVNFDQLIPYLDDFSEAEITKDKTIIITARNFLDKDNSEKLTEIFNNRFSFDSLHIIHLIRNSISNTEMNNLKKDRLYYMLPDSSAVDHEIYIKNLVLYINTVFQLLVDKERINDYIVDSFRMIVDTELIKQQKLEIETLNRKLDELSKIDYLTNLLNRRALFEELERERKRAMRSTWRLSNENNLTYDRREKKPFAEKSPKGTFLDHYGQFTCIMIDIDFFKKINDTKGHLVGDHVLQKLGELLIAKQIVRETDIVGRYGGEEFIVLLSETNIENSISVAKRLRQKIKQEEFFDVNGNPFHITVSMGMSEFLITDKTKEDIIKRADEALYYSKNHGRDKIVLYKKNQIRPLNAS